MLAKAGCGKNIVSQTKETIVKFSLYKRLVIAVLKDVSLPLAVSLSDGRLSIKQSKEIATVIFEAVSRELLNEKLMKVEKENINEQQ